MRNIAAAVWIVTAAVSVVLGDTPASRPVGGDSAPKMKWIRNVEGRSEVSYELALRQAWLEAVRRGAGVWVDGHSRIEHFDLIRDSLYARSQGYVRDHRVVRKHFDQQRNVYVVVIDAQVALGSITGADGDFAALQQLLSLVGRPDFRVEVEAAVDSDAGKETGRRLEAQMTTWIRGAMEKRIGRLNLQVRYAPVAKESQLREYLKAVAAGDDVRAANIKTVLGEPFGVYVKAYAKVHQVRAWDVDLSEVTVALQARIVSRSQGRIVGSAAAESTSVRRVRLAGLKDAAGRAGEKVFEACLEKLLQAWARQIDEGVQVDVEVTGLDKYVQVVALKTHLEKIARVEQVRVVEFNRAGLSVLSVRGRINAEAIADALSRLDYGDWNPQPRGMNRVVCQRGGPAEPAATRK